MFYNWSDFDRTFAALDELRRRLDAPMFRSYSGAAATWPRVSVADTGSALAVTAEVPGLTADDVEVELDKGTLTLSGQRRIDIPEGYSVHRQERGAHEFKRSFTLPVAVDPEKVSATVQNGLLQITLEKAAEARPRQIAVKSA